MGNIAVCAMWSVGDAQNCSILLALLKPPHGCLQLCYCPLSVPDSVAKISGRQGLEVGAWEQNNLEGSGSLCWRGNPSVGKAGLLQMRDALFSVPWTEQQEARFSAS